MRKGLAELEGGVREQERSEPPPQPTPKHDEVVADWRAHARPNGERNFEFLRSLKCRDYGFEPDEVAAKLHAEAFQIVDCSRCANCCKTMVVKMKPEDIDRIAGHLGMASEEFVAAYLESDGQDGYKIRQQPCPFLGNDDRCTIYDVRPRDCRDYPHTDKEGFVFRTMLHANNALHCPAVFWIVEQMRQRARR